MLEMCFLSHVRTPSTRIYRQLDRSIYAQRAGYKGENVGSIRSVYVNDKIMWIGRARPAPYISKKCLSVILMGRPGEFCFGSMCLLDFLRFISDRTDSNADSTLDVSRADVSMYIMPFSAVNKTNGAW